MKQGKRTHDAGDRLDSCDWTQTPSVYTADGTGTESQLFAVISVNRQIVLGKHGPGKRGETTHWVAARLSCPGV